MRLREGGVLASAFDLVIRGGQAVTPNGLVETDIGLSAGRIAGIGDLRGAAGEVFDAKGLHILPGVIDSQVHFREPGLEHKEDLATGTAAAALGGVTAIFEMPNTKPSTTTVAAIADKVARASGRAYCDFAFFVGAAAENVEQLGGLERLPGCAGVKLFMGSSTGTLLVEDDETIRKVLRHGHRRVAIHAEDEFRLRERWALVKDGADPEMHPVWRDVETALNATRRVLRLARETGRRVHLLHITTAEEAALLGEYKDIATMELLPQHLTLVAPDCYRTLGTFAQMNPPIREPRHRDALWRAIEGGVADCIGSDHAPHSREEKAKPYPQSPSGLPGVQTLLPLLLNHLNEGRLSLLRLVDLTSAGPARVYNVAGKGRIALGYDGDLTLVDLKARHRISHAEQASRCGWTPFDGMTVTGWPVAMILRGHVAMRDGALVGPPSGQPVRFTETLAARS